MGLGLKSKHSLRQHRTIRIIYVEQLIKKNSDSCYYIVYKIISPLVQSNGMVK